MKRLPFIIVATLLIASCRHIPANTATTRSGSYMVIADNGTTYSDTDIIGNEKSGIVIARGKETVYDYTDAKATLNREAGTK